MRSSRVLCVLAAKLSHCVRVSLCVRMCVRAKVRERWARAGMLWCQQVLVFDMADWNQLPDCALVSMLSYVNKDVRHGWVLVLAAPCVSKQWRQACERLHARIDVSLQWASQLTDAGLRSIVERFPRAVTIVLAGRRSVTDSGIECVAASCSQLSSLNLSDCSEVTDRGVGKLAGGCPQLSSAIAVHLGDARVWARTCMQA